ncbi:MAG: hypothetical protein H0U90_08170 [Actinobacteria bacterium]|nr:hypothetical protein [Actinomycetota bacterium]
MAALPPLPYDEWEEAKLQLHLVAQIVGKVSLGLSHPWEHWWHVTFSVSPRGVRTGPMPYEGGFVKLELDLVDHVVVVTTNTGERRTLPLDVPLRDFYRELTSLLAELGVTVEIQPRAYKMDADDVFSESARDAYDREAVERYHQVLLFSADVLEEHGGRFGGKSSRVMLFWHSLDLSLVRYSGGGMISSGFWPGDKRVRMPAYSSYVWPVPAGLREQPVRPEAASWSSDPESALVLLPYDAVREADDPRGTLLEFLQSSYEAGARASGWDVEGLGASPPE